MGPLTASYISAAGGGHTGTDQIRYGVPLLYLLAFAASDRLVNMNKATVLRKRRRWQLKPCLLARQS